MTNRLPWELELTPQQIVYLRACEALGLIPDWYDIGYRVAASMSGVKRQDFMPNVTYQTATEAQDRISDAITRQAKRVAIAGDIR